MAGGVLMTSLERLIRTHPIWFLPRVDRDEAQELLRSKEAGVSTFSLITLNMARSSFVWKN